MGVASTLATATRVSYAILGKYCSQTNKIIEPQIFAGMDANNMASADAENFVTSTLSAILSGNRLAFAGWGEGAVSLSAVTENSGGKPVLWLSSPQCMIGVWHPPSEVMIFAAIVCHAARAAFTRWQRELVRMALVYETERHSQLDRIGDILVQDLILDRIALGLVVVDPSMRLVYANPAAHDYLEASQDLRLIDGRLATVSRESHKRLISAVHAATMATPSRSAVVQLPLNEDEECTIPQTVTVTPLSPAPAYALVICGRKTNDVLLRDMILQELGLTPAEKRLTHLLMSGKCLEAAANHSNLKVSTARSYLRQVFEKTCTHRQSELVSLISDITPPIEIKKRQKKPSSATTVAGAFSGGRHGSSRRTAPPGIGADAR